MLPSMPVEKRAFRCAVGIRQQRGGPVFVGDAEPAVGDVEIDELLFLDVLVGEFLQPGITQHADQAFMENVVAERLRRAVARNQRIRIKSDRVRALVGHLILDGEQEFVVDRDRAAKFEPFAVVVGQCDRIADTERARTRPRPHGFRCRQFDVGAAGAGPAEFGIEGIGACPTAKAARSAAISDRRSRGIAPARVVDAAALERDRALHIIGRDRNARRSRERRGAVDRRGGRGRGRLAGDLRRVPDCAGAGGVWPGCAGVGVPCFCCWACSCSCRAFSCGMPTKYCQPISTSAESTMARMVFLLSFITIPFCHCVSRAHAATPLRSPASLRQTAD